MKIDSESNQILILIRDIPPHTTDLFLCGIIRENRSFQNAKKNMEVQVSNMKNIPSFQE